MNRSSEVVITRRGEPPARIVEFASALAKKTRTGEMDAETCREIRDAFQDDLMSIQVEVINLFDEDYDKAAELTFEFGIDTTLRTLDSLQLAAALREPRSLFLSSDVALKRIADRIGLRRAPWPGLSPGVNTDPV